MIRKRDIIKMVKNKPFEPFRIHVSDGSTHEVHNPEMIKVTPSLAIVFTPDPDEPIVAISDYNLVSMLHITRLELVTVNSKGKKHA